MVETPKNSRRPVGSPSINVIQAVEGETNPRNLHLIFGIWPLVMSHFELAEYTEDVFELFSCYFPIDFNPSKVGYVLICSYDLTY